MDGRYTGSGFIRSFHFSECCHAGVQLVPHRCGKASQRLQFSDNRNLSDSSFVGMTRFRIMESSCLIRYCKCMQRLLKLFDTIIRIHYLRTFQNSPLGDKGKKNPSARSKRGSRYKNPEHLAFAHDDLFHGLNTGCRNNYFQTIHSRYQVIYLDIIVCNSFPLFQYTACHIRQ